GGVQAAARAEAPAPRVRLRAQVLPRLQQPGCGRRDQRHRAPGLHPPGPQPLPRLRGGIPRHARATRLPAPPVRLGEGRRAGGGVMVARDLLLEIGTEEIPAAFFPGAIEEPRKLILAGLDAARLTHGETAIYGTPRRLSVLVREVIDAQPDVTREEIGPPA